MPKIGDRFDKLVYNQFTIGIPPKVCTWEIIGFCDVHGSSTPGAEVRLVSVREFAEPDKIQPGQSLEDAVKKCYTDGGEEIQPRR